MKDTQRPSRRDPPGPPCQFAMQILSAPGVQNHSRGGAQEVDLMLTGEDGAPATHGSSSSIHTGGTGLGDGVGVGVFWGVGVAVGVGTEGSGVGDANGVGLADGAGGSEGEGVGVLVGLGSGRSTHLGGFLVTSQIWPGGHKGPSTGGRHCAATRAQLIPARIPSPFTFSHTLALLNATLHILSEKKFNHLTEGEGIPTLSAGQLKFLWNEKIVNVIVRHKFIRHLCGPSFYQPLSCRWLTR